jgi:Mn2+/Fe2+ NRAMP family transporter
MSATSSKWTLPWRTILAIYGTGLLLSSANSIFTKVALTNMSAADPELQEILSQRLVGNIAFAALGAILLGVGLTLAITRRARNRAMKKAG